MSSRYLKISVVMLILVGIGLSQSGCDKFLKGRSSSENLNDQIVTVSTDEVDCMKEVPSGLEKFFEDRADEKALKQTVSCVQHSLKTFMRLTRGKVANGYLAKEVQFFFNRNLVKKGGVQITDEFLDEIMKVKVVAVGGTYDVMTRLELEQFIQFLGDLEKELVQIQGMVQLLSFKAAAADYQSKRLEKLKTGLMALGQFVLKKTKIAISSYQFNDFKGFLTHLNHFMGGSKPLDELLKWMPAAESVKFVFLGENAKLVGPGDWENSTKWVIETYISLLRFYYEIKDKPFETPREWQLMISWLDEIIERVEQSPAMKEKKILEARALDRLIDEVFGLKLFETILSPELVKSTYKKALVYFIEASGVRGDPQLISGLTGGHFRVLKQEYNVWKLSQNAIIETYAGNPKQTIQTLSSAVDKMNSLSRLDALALEKDELKRSWTDFQKLLRLDPAITYDEKTKVQISYRIEDNLLPFVGANMLNSIRTYTRLALRGYGNREGIFTFDQTLSRQRLIELQAHFQEFAEAIGFVDRRSKNSASNTFNHGDLLVYHSDGDDLLNANEIYELLSFMISGGRTQLNEIYKDLKNRNCLREGKDIFGKNFVDEDCFYQSLRQRYATYFDNLPGFVYFMKSLNDQQFAQMYRGLLNISISPEHVNGQLESPEIRSMTTVIHYIEAIVRFYDKDKNLMLSEEEIVASVPRFRKVVAKMSPMGDFLIEDIVLYLAHHGKKPDRTQLLTFVAKRHTPFLGLGEIGKMNIINLLGVLKSDLESD